MRKMILLRQKLLHKGIFAERHNAVLIVSGHFVQRIFQVVFHCRKVLRVTVRYVYQKNGGICSSPFLNGKTEQRQQNHKNPYSPHHKIKKRAGSFGRGGFSRKRDPAVTHLPQVYNPFRRHKQQDNHQQHIAKLLLYKLPAVRILSHGSFRNGPSVGLFLRGKTHYIRFRYIPCGNMIQTRLLRFRRQRTHVKIRLRMKQYRFPRLIDIVGQKRSFSQKPNRIGYKNREFRL